MLLYFVIDLAAQLKISCIFILCGILILVCITFLLQSNTHCMKSRHSNKTNFEALFFFLGAQFENIVHFYFVWTLILVGTIFLLKFDMHCARNPNILTKSNSETLNEALFMLTLNTELDRKIRFGWIKQTTRSGEISLSKWQAAWRYSTWKYLPCTYSELEAILFEK